MFTGCVEMQRRANFARMTGFINQQIRFWAGQMQKSLPREAFLYCIMCKTNRCRRDWVRTNDPYRVKVVLYH